VQPGDDLSVDDAMVEITTLLAAAYQRRARLRLIRPTPEPVPSTEALDNTAEPSPHELTLTRRRKESHRS
jgi:hypothetical protein